MQFLFYNKLNGMNCRFSEFFKLKWNSIQNCVKFVINFTFLTKKNKSRKHKLTSSMLMIDFKTVLVIFKSYPNIGFQSQQSWIPENFQPCFPIQNFLLKLHACIKNLANYLTGSIIFWSTVKIFFYKETKFQSSRVNSIVFAEQTFKKR